MHDWQSLSHVRWECKYHVVIIPKYRRKVFYGRLRRQIGLILRELCRQRGIELMEGHAMPDHVHLCLSIPPKYSVAHAIGFLKGKRQFASIGSYFMSAGRRVCTSGQRDTVSGRWAWMRSECGSTSASKKSWTDKVN
jgi:REP element-mobilizing transposase RayT